MSPVRKRNLAVAGAVAAAVLAGGAGIATAASPGAGAPGTTQQQTGTTQQQTGAAESEAPGTETPDAQEGKEGPEGHEAGEPSINGSVPAPGGGQSDTGTEQDGSAAETAEAQALAPLATVTQAEATSAALAAVPGAAGTVSLDDEDGFVVWSVEVTTSDGSVVDVKIDAGNAAVLAQDSGEDGAAAGG